MGLPVVLDTNDDSIREGQRVSEGSSLAAAECACVAALPLLQLADLRRAPCCCCAPCCMCSQVLLTYKGQDIAVVEVESKWVPNKVAETKACYGTASLEHPGTLMVATERGKYYLGGRVHGLELPKRCVGGGGVVTTDAACLPVKMQAFVQLCCSVSTLTRPWLSCGVTLRCCQGVPLCHARAGAR